jgi:hypothetical protein
LRLRGHTPNKGLLAAHVDPLDAGVSAAVVDVDDARRRLFASVL